MEKHNNIPPLSEDFDCDNAQPYFIWDVPITFRELKERLHHSNVDTKVLWIARVLREARYPDVWKLLTLGDILPLYVRVRKHLGRMRRFWDFLLEGWHKDGLISFAP